MICFTYCIFSLKRLLFYILIVLSFWQISFATFACLRLFFRLLRQSNRWLSLIFPSSRCWFVIRGRSWYFLLLGLNFSWSRFSFHRCSGRFWLELWIVWILFIFVRGLTPLICFSQFRLFLLPLWLRIHCLRCIYIFVALLWSRLIACVVHFLYYSGSISNSKFIVDFK